MATITVRVGALDFAAIDEALGRVRIAVSVDGDLDLSSFDVGSVLGDVAPIVEAVRQLDGDSEAIVAAARAALESLADLVELPEMDRVEDLVEGLANLSDLLTELFGILTESDGSRIVDRLLSEVGGSLDLGGFVGDIAGRAAEAMRVDVPEPLVATFERLARLGTGTPKPEELAEVVLDTLTGIELAVVTRLSTGLNSAVEIAATAGNAEPLEILMARAHAEIDAVIRVSGRAEIDGAELDALIDELVVLNQSLDQLAGVELPRFVDGFTADLRTCRNVLAEIDVSKGLDDLVGGIPRPGIEPVELLVQPLRELAGGLDAVTSASITGALETARDELTAFVRIGELAELLNGIDDAQRRVVRLLRGLPAEEIRDTMLSVLREAQREILSFTGFAFLDELTAPIRALAASLDELDTSAVGDSMQGIVDSVNETFADFPIDELRDAVDAVIEPLGAIVDEAAPLLLEITAQLESLVAEVDGINFDAAGAEVIEQLAEIRAQVNGALDTDSVPDALKAVIGAAAATLKAMDITAEIDAPFKDAVAHIEIDALLEPVTELWDELGAALLRATPEALIDELDPPFEEMLARLDEISLAPLTDSLGEVFGDLVDVLRRADPRELLAPLDAEFQQIVARLNQTLDPAPLFAPARAAYDGLLAEIEAIDIEAAINEMLGGIADTPKMLTDAVGDQLQEQGDGSGLPVPGDEAFRFGDVLRPLVALMAEIRGRLHGLSNDVTEEGFALLAQATRELRAVLDPVGGFSIAIADHLDKRRGWFDAGVRGGPLAELQARLAGLDQALLALDLDASGRARIDGVSGGVSLQARVELDVSVAAPGVDAVEGTRDAADPPGLGRSVRLAVRSLDDLLPAALVDGALDPRAGVDAFIDALIDPFDPAPLAAELDALGEQIMAKLAEFVDELSLGLLAVWNELIAGVQPLMPSSLVARIQSLIDAVAAELAILDPAAIEDEARRVVSATVGLLALYSPAKLAAELGTVFDEAIEIVESLDPAALLGDLDPFADLRADLALLRPSDVLEPLVVRSAALTGALEVIASVDLNIAAELVARLEVAFDAVLEGVKSEFDALLNELEGLSGGSIDVSVSVSTG